uniref:Uncharacterized protein n=1 Tax=Onchocerca volvulus TaxID=6282 RepID=A0A8R1Y133_ONCVO
MNMNPSSNQKEKMLTPLSLRQFLQSTKITIRQRTKLKSSSK